MCIAGFRSRYGCDGGAGAAAAYPADPAVNALCQMRSVQTRPWRGIVPESSWRRAGLGLGGVPRPAPRAGLQTRITRIFRGALARKRFDWVLAYASLG